MSCFMWRSQTKHLTSYQWERENNWVSGKLSGFSQEFLCFYSKSSLSTRATHTRKSTTSQTKHFSINYPFVSLLYSLTYLDGSLFWIVCCFRSASFASTASLFGSTVMSCLAGIGLAKKSGTGLFGVVLQGFLEQFIAGCYVLADWGYYVVLECTL